jgi:RsiW-degrading membrane proteinase PrsW (M82 family)
VKASRLTAGGAVVRLGLLTAFVLLITFAAMDTWVFVVASLVAVLPLPVYLALALWFDRWEPEPRALLATAFLWGASVAILASGFLNAFTDALVGDTLGTIVAGPINEEVTKGLVLYWLYRRRPDEFDGVIDGLIYAAMVGLGFAFVENIDYYGRAFAKEGAGGLAVTFTLRGVLGPFSHPLFTAMTGLGLGLARQTHRVWLKRIAPPLGPAGAIALHALWNGGATMGCVFFGIYLLVMVPALAAVLVLIVVSLRREGRLVRTWLAPEAESGALGADEYQRLCSLRGRVDAGCRAWAMGGRRAWRIRHAVHRAASELAFLRDRVARGTQPPDPDLEGAYLRILVGERPEAGSEAGSQKQEGTSP